MFIALLSLFFDHNKEPLSFLERMKHNVKKKENKCKFWFLWGAFIVFVLLELCLYILFTRFEKKYSKCVGPKLNALWFFQS